MKKFFAILLLIFSGISCLAQGTTTTSTTSVAPILSEIGVVIRNVAIVSAVLMIVIGGFKWMTSAGDPSKVSDAKDQIFAAILGLVIIAIAEIIAALVGG
jgi:hypothetical protein